MKVSRGIAAESMGAHRAPTTAPMHSASASAPDRLQGIIRSRNAAEIPLAKIGPDPDQPREEFEPEALARLADSLKARGQLQPIRVRWDEDRGQYIIVCGERRWRAAELAGLPTMSCVILDGPVAPAELLALQLVENMLREDLRPIEQARAFRTLIDSNGWSTRQLAAELAVTQSDVVRALALLELPSPVQEQVEQGTLPPSTAYEISKVEDPAAQAELAARVVSEGLSRQETVAAVRRSASKPARAKGRGGKPHKATSRVFRSPTSRVTVELKKGSGDAAMLAALREATRVLESEMGADESAAA
jgi:ParB family chromosome partitioning protein